MRASTDTLLSLAEWGEIMGVNLWELAQFGAGFPAENGRQCQHVFYQYQWQRDFISREEIAGAIEKAEAAIALQLKYWPAPKYLDDTVERPPQTRSRAGPARYGVGLPFGYVHGGGILARAEIDPGAAVTRTDEDGDGVKETFTVSVATALTDSEEIALYYTAADRNNLPLGETWRIRPVNVAISGGTATITGHASLLVVPDKTLAVDPAELNVTLDANYVTAVAVYRVYRDTTAAEATPNQGWAIWNAVSQNPCTSTPCVPSTRAICVDESFTEGRQVYVSYPDPSTCVHWRKPDRIRVKYLAGVPREQGRMARMYADAVAHLATAWLPADKCGCERSQRILHWWRALPNDDERETGRRPVTFDEIMMPFGERRGAVYAWKLVRELKQHRAVSL